MVDSWKKHQPEISRALFLIESARRPISGMGTPAKYLQSLPNVDEIVAEGGNKSIAVTPEIAEQTLNLLKGQMHDSTSISRSTVPEYIARLITRSINNIYTNRKPRLYTAFTSRATNSTPPARASVQSARKDAWATLREFLVNPENKKHTRLVSTIDWLLRGQKPRTPKEAELQKLLARKPIKDLVRHRINLRAEYAVQSKERGRAIQQSRHPGGRPVQIPPKPTLFRRKIGK